MALSTILRLLMAAGRTKKAAKVGKAMLSKGKSLPKKSKDMPGVKTAKSKPRKEFDADKAWEQQMDEFYGYGPHPTMTQANPVMRRPDIPVNVQLKNMHPFMRKNPGIGAGLQRLESRKASALNTGGTPWSGKALRYEPTVKRAAKFNSLFATDKGFRSYIKDWVGRKKWSDLTPKMKDDLAKRYLLIKRRGLSEAENEYKAIMGKATYKGPGYSRSGPDNVGQTGPEHPIYGVPGVDF